MLTRLMNWPIGWFSVWFFYDKALRAIRFQMSWLFFYLWKSLVDMSIFLICMPYIAFGKVLGQLKHRHWGYNRISTRIMKVNNKIIFVCLTSSWCGATNSTCAVFRGTTCVSRVCSTWNTINCWRRPSSQWLCNNER